MGLDNIFGKHQFLPSDTKIINLNNKWLFIKREKEGWYFLVSEEFNEGNLDFSRGEYFQTGKSNSLIIVPALPDKPLVFKGDMLKVSAGQKFTFFLKIPASLHFFYSKSQPENLMKEIVPKQLSRTWFGEPDNGEPALAVGNEYFLEFEATETLPFEIICPVTIINNSAVPFEVKRLIIRTENLTIYKTGNKKVTSFVHVEFRGQDAINPVKYTYSKFYDDENQELFAKSRSANNKNQLRNTIKNRLKNNKA